MKPTAFERAQSTYAPPRNRAEARARQQALARNQRAHRRSRARVERALSQYPKESS